MNNIIKVSFLIFSSILLFNTSCNKDKESEKEITAEYVKDFIIKNYETSSSKELVKFNYDYDASKTTNEEYKTKYEEELKLKAEKYKVEYLEGSLLLSYELSEGDEFDYQKDSANVKIDTKDIEIWESQKSETNTYNYFTKGKVLTVINKRVFGNETVTYTRVYNNLGQKEKLIYDSYETCEDATIISSFDTKTYTY